MNVIGDMRVLAALRGFSNDLRFIPHTRAHTPCRHTGKQSKPLRYDIRSLLR